jgi:hypothetical protein
MCHTCCVRPRHAMDPEPECVYHHGSHSGHSTASATCGGGVEPGGLCGTKGTQSCICPGSGICTPARCATGLVSCLLTIGAQSRRFPRHLELDLVPSGTGTACSLLIAGRWVAAPDSSDWHCSHGLGIAAAQPRAGLSQGVSRALVCLLPQCLLQQYTVVRHCECPAIPSPLPQEQDLH